MIPVMSGGLSGRPEKLIGDDKSASSSASTFRAAAGCSMRRPISLGGGHGVKARGRAVSQRPHRKLAEHQMLRRDDKERRYVGCAFTRWTRRCASGYGRG